MDVQSERGFGVEKLGANHRALLRAQSWSRRFGIVLCALFALLVWLPAAAAIPSSERAVLVDLYNQTNGAGWTKNTGWNGPVGTECSWYGVTCDDAQTHVIAVGLDDGDLGNHLVGTLPSIAALTKLQSFHVNGPRSSCGTGRDRDSEYQGHLTGTLPDLSGLQDLEYFAAQNNHFTGTIPVLAGLTKLTRFYVGINDLTGEIPRFEGLSKLTFFYACRNQLTGTIPDFGSTPKMQEFRISFNQLTGTIPDWSQLSNLDSADLDHNQLSGAIPPLPAKALLYDIDVSHNRLTGILPAFPIYGPYATFNVSFNLLSGDLPAAPQGTNGRRGYALCPHLFNRKESKEWDDLVGESPWYADCFDAKVNLNQFGLTGTWYNPTTSGQGFMFQSFPDLHAVGQGLFFGGWFTFERDWSPSTYHGDPSPAQHWYSLQGNVDNLFPYAQLDIYTGTSGNFAAPPRITPVKVGTALLALSDCGHATLKYDFDASIPKSMGSIPLTRLSGNSRCTPVGDNGAAATNFLLSGSWYDAETSGQGIVLDINPDTNLLFAAWYTYTKNGAQTGGTASQRWFTLQTNQFAPGASAVSNVEILTATDGLFDDPKPVTSQRHLGTADIAFQDCATMTLSYRFDAGENAGEIGTMRLTRLGPVPAGCKLP